jgi:hypothetical protein
MALCEERRGERGKTKRGVVRPYILGYITLGLSILKSDQKGKTKSLFSHYILSTNAAVLVHPSGLRLIHARPSVSVIGLDLALGIEPWSHFFCTRIHLPKLLEVRWTGELLWQEFGIVDKDEDFAIGP